MKILQILTHSTPSDLGVDPRFYEGDWHVKVAKEIVKRTNKYTVECWRPERTFKRTFVREDENGIVYRIFPSIYLKYSEYSLPLIKSLSREIEQNKEILLHIHGLYNLITYSVSLHVGKKVPIVAQSHGGHPIHIPFKKSSHSQQSFYYPFEYVLRHAPFRNKSNPPLRFFYYPFEYILQHTSFHNIDHFFVLSKEELAYFSAVFGQEKVEILPMGIDFYRFRPIGREEARKKLGLDKDKPYLLYVGRLTDMKGLDYLLLGLKYALNEIPDLQLILVGDGPYRSKLDAMSRVMGIKDHVLFISWKPPEELPMYYNAANVFVFPSFQESWGIAPLEALACKIPIISTAVGCIPQLAEELKDGIFIIPKKDPIAIKECIIKVLNQVDKISERIPREKLKKYSWDEIIKKTLATYDKLFVR